MIPRERIFWKDVRLNTNNEIRLVGGGRGPAWEIGRAYRYDAFGVPWLNGFLCTKDPGAALRSVGGNALAVVEAWGRFDPYDYWEPNFDGEAEYMRVLGVFSYKYLSDNALLSLPYVDNSEGQRKGVELGRTLLDMLDRQGMLRPSIDVFDPELELKSFKRKGLSSDVCTYDDGVVVQTLPEIRSDLKIVAAQVVTAQNPGAFSPGDRVLVKIDRMRRIRPHDAFEVPMDDVIGAV